MRKLLLVFLIFPFISATAQHLDLYMVKGLWFGDRTLEDLRKTYPKACRFYNSVDDYNNDKPVANMDWKPGSYRSGKIEVTRNGTGTKTKISELQARFVSDEQGLLMRVFEKEMYTIVVNDALCYYVKYGDGYVYKTPEGDLTFGRNSMDKFFDYYSETLDGEPVLSSDKYLKNKLKEAGLLDAWEQEKIKREMSDSVDGYRTKVIRKNIKYLNIMNYKAKK